MRRQLMLIAIVTGLVTACSPGADPERPAGCASQCQLGR